MGARMNWLHFTAGAALGMMVMFALMILAVGLTKRMTPEHREATDKVNRLLTTANEHRDEIATALDLLASSADTIASKPDETRVVIATAAMQGLLADHMDRADEILDGETCAEATARLAVEHADALLRALNREGGE